MSWAIDVYSPDGTMRRTLTPADPVDHVRWGIRGDGDCLEAEITGASLDLRHRDVIHIRAGLTPSGPLLPRYWGWVTQSVDPAHTGLATTLAIGGRKRLTELVTRATVLGDNDPAGRDVALHALSAAAATVAGQPLLTAPAAAFPQLGFSLGYRLPRLETLEETLTALAAAVPGFTVEPSSSYTYSGLTFTAGQEVPSTRWGVRVSNDPLITLPEVFFARDITSFLMLDEVTDKLILEYPDLSSEDLVDDVTVLLFADTNAQSWSKFRNVISGHPVDTPEPVLYRLAAGTSYGAQRVVEIPPLDGMAKIAIAGSPSVTDWTNAGNAIDSNLTTYAANAASRNATLELNLPWETVALKIRYSAHAEVRVTFTHRYNNFSPRYVVIATLPTTNGEQRDHLLLLPTEPATATCTKTVQLATPTPPRDGLLDPQLVADSVRIYDVSAYAPHEPTLARVAASHFHLPSSTAAIVTIPNVLEWRTSRWLVHRAAGDTLQGLAEQIEYTIDREAGFTTRIHLNQALSGEAMSQRALLDARIRSAVRTAVRASR